MCRGAAAEKASNPYLLGCQQEFIFILQLADFLQLGLDGVLPLVNWGRYATWNNHQSIYSTHRRPLWRRHFIVSFSYEKLCILINTMKKNLTEICSRGSIEELTCNRIGSNDCLVPKGRQDIFWTNDGLDFWGIYASNCVACACRWGRRVKTPLNSTRVDVSSWPQGQNGHQSNRPTRI